MTLMILQMYEINLLEGVVRLQMLSESGLFWIFNDMMMSETGMAFWGAILS